MLYNMHMHHLYMHGFAIVCSPIPQTPDPKRKTPSESFQAKVPKGRLPSECSQRKFASEKIQVGVSKRMPPPPPATFPYHKIQTLELKRFSRELSPGSFRLGVFVRGRSLGSSRLVVVVLKTPKASKVRSVAKKLLM